MSATRKWSFCLSGCSENHLITASVFFHWLYFVLAFTFATSLLRICLDTLPISVLVGLISRQEGASLKFGLVSFRVMLASLLLVLKILSARSSLCAIVCVLPY